MGIGNVILQQWHEQQQLRAAYAEAVRQIGPDAKGAGMPERTERKAA